MGLVQKWRKRKSKNEALRSAYELSDQENMRLFSLWNDMLVCKSLVKVIEGD